MSARVITPRNTIAAALLLAVVGFIGSELIERVGGLVPCELCLIQRWSVFGAALFLAVSLLSPRRWLSVSGCAVAAIAGAAGLAAAVRHVWLQTHPGEPLGCLPDFFGRSAVAAAAPSPSSDLASLASPLQVLAPAHSACSAPQGLAMGFTVADWSLAYAVALALVIVGAFAVAMLGNRRAAAQLRA